MRFRGPICVGVSVWLVVGRNGDGSSTVLGIYHWRQLARVHRWWVGVMLAPDAQKFLTVRERRFDVINPYRPLLAAPDAEHEDA